MVIYITSNFPKHIVMIPDGNRRFALKNKISLLEAYRIASEKATLCIECFFEDFNIPIFSAYSLSLDNVLKRPEAELIPIYNIQVMTYEKWLKSGLLQRNKIKVKFIGETTILPRYYQDIIKELEKTTRRYNKHKLYILSAYSGKFEVIKAVEKFSNEFSEEKIKITDVDPFYNCLYIPEPVDFTIRTGGEKRLSDCLIYQTAYSELYFTDKLFPEITKKNINDAIKEYTLRERKQGK